MSRLWCRMHAWPSCTFVHAVPGGARGARLNDGAALEVAAAALAANSGDVTATLSELVARAMSGRTVP